MRQILKCAKVYITIVEASLVEELQFMYLFRSFLCSTKCQTENDPFFRTEVVCLNG
jgi:hypothetical protein